MKDRARKNLEDSLRLIKEIGNFCYEKKEKDYSKALLYLISNFESTLTLFTLLLEKYNTLETKSIDESIKIDTYQHINNLIIDQSRFTFIATMSSLEFTAKNISLKDGFAVKKFLDTDKERKNKKRKYLNDIMYASEKIGLISGDEKTEWEFFSDIRNAIVHNNAILDKDLKFIIYDKLYSFEKNKLMDGNIQSLFLFSKRIAELFYNWSQKHEKINL